MMLALKNKFGNTKINKHIEKKVFHTFNIFKNHTKEMKSVHFNRNTLEEALHYIIFCTYIQRL